MFSLYIAEKYGYKQSILLLSIYSGIASFVLFIYRIAILLLKSTYYRFQKNKSKIGIIGFNQTGIELAESFESDFMAFHFEGILDEEHPIFLEKKEDKFEKINLLIHESKLKNISELYLCESPELLADIGKIFKNAEKQCIKCQAQETNEAYIDAETHLLPCCYLAGAKFTLDPDDPHDGYYKHWTEFGSDKIKLDRNDWDDVVNGEYFKELTNTWQQKFGEGRLLVCSGVCSSNEVQFSIYKNVKDD
jgi:hypothetical protein